MNDQISDMGKQAIRKMFFKLGKKGILKPAEIRDLIARGRDSFRIAQSVTTNAILQFLLKERLMTQARLDFPSRKETRYFSTEPNIYELALSAGRNSYLTHHTAMYFHGLTEKEPSIVYVNSEQGAKTTGEPELTQDAIDQAFQRPPRKTRNFTRYARRTIYLLNGKFTGALGVIGIPLNKSSGRVTDLERTLVDITVRPQYSGGMSGVWAAYRKAGDKVSIPRIADLLMKLDFVYPYHQAIGLCLEKTGRFSPKDLTTLRQIPKEFDFYLTHQIKSPAYSKEWRIYYPRG